jgi:hypothetical protein
MSEIINNPDKIEIARLMTMRSMLKLEIKGMKHSDGVSVYSKIKKTTWMER